jgi:hypothetical protein
MLSMRRLRTGAEVGPLAGSGFMLRIDVRALGDRIDALENVLVNAHC